MRRQWLIGALGCLVVILAPAACSGSGAGPKPAPSSPATVQPSLKGTATQYTVDEGTRNLRVAITNVGHSTVTVTSATLDWAGFAPKQTKIPDGALGPGETAGLVMPYGAPRCATKPTGKPALGVTVDGTELPFPLAVSPDPQLLDRLYQHECAEQRLNETATVSLVVSGKPIVRGGGEFLPAEVVVQRQQNNDGVTVLDLNGSILLQFVPAQGSSELPARLAPGQSTLRLPVLIGSPNRCDAHARGNSSQTFLFGIDVRLDGEPSQRVIVFPDKAAQGRLFALLDRVCQ